MTPEFRQCLEKHRIVEFERGPALISKEIDSAGEDLLSSKDSFEAGNHKWTTIQAYYSMFHTARALIYAEKYREKSHYCLVVALDHLYVRRGILGKEFIESLSLGRELREAADYRSTFSSEGADNLIQAAENFLDAARKILGTA